jgi:cell division protein FtsB
MSYNMNLIPQTYRARMRRGRTRRSVAIALAISGLAIGVVGWSLHVGVLHERAELEDLKSYVAEMRAVAADAQALQDRIDDLHRQLEAQQTLQHPVNVSHIMATLCGLMPASVTLDSMELRSSLRSLEGGGGAGRANLPIKDEEKTERVMICEVTGVARSDLDVADFVGRLTDHPLYREVALDYSRPVTVREVSGRSFRISCNIDLERRYEVDLLPVDPWPGPGGLDERTAEVSDGA